MKNINREKEKCFILTLKNDFLIYNRSFKGYINKLLTKT